ncbi:hypothetical protein QBC32DRAFT_401535 [Pseudoneurospora amorphoporcata]|uniref:Uncharacterized protein n=1 Tax=Pseudoneurospora amorphoporcata TaxID=241081 RepID=A0AAN6NKI4_9PEZI|nr:hypothetical protein QBC32DRAFT_401535 [Pseudoneurospora amorphoporcata]
MDPISAHLTHWMTFISRLAALSVSLHGGYHRARNGVVGFASLCGAISRTLANLSRCFGSSLSSLELQDILLLWALLRALRRFVPRLLGRLGFALPALPVWLRQLGSALAVPAVPALPSALSGALPGAPPFGPPSAPPSLLSSVPGAPSFGLRAPGAPSALLSAFLSAAPSALPSASLSASPYQQALGQLSAGLSAALGVPSSARLPSLPSVSSSASAPGPLAPPVQLSWPGYPGSSPSAPLSICSDGSSSRSCSSLWRSLSRSALWRACSVCPVVCFGLWRSSSGFWRSCSAL